MRKNSSGVPSVPQFVMMGGGPGRATVWQLPCLVRVVQTILIGPMQAVHKLTRQPVAIKACLTLALTLTLILILLANELTP